MAGDATSATTRGIHLPAQLRVYEMGATTSQEIQERLQAHSFNEVAEDTEVSYHIVQPSCAPFV